MFTFYRCRWTSRIGFAFPILGMLVILLVTCTGFPGRPLVAVEPKATASATSKSITLYEATDSQIKDLENAASRCATAADALLVYNNFRHTHRISTALKNRYDDQHKLWKSRADQGLIKMGSAWITLEKAEIAGKEADKLIEEAYEAIDAKNEKQARDLFLKASRRDSGGIRADFMLGLLNTPLQANHLPAAQQHFVEVLTRWPGHVAALNNLALIDVRMRRHDTALGRWEMALHTAPHCEAIICNLRRFMDESKAGNITASTTHVKLAGRLLEKVAAKPGKQSGWRYIPLLLPVQEAKRSIILKSETRIESGHGIGFVVAPQLVVTTLKSVADADEIVGTGAGHGQVIAENPDLGIALVRFRDLHAAPLKLDASTPSNKTSPLQIILDDFSQPNTPTRSVSGDFFGVSGDRQFLYLTSKLSQGEAGGPVCDAAGNAIALHMGQLKAETGLISAAVLIEPILVAFKAELSKADTKVSSAKLTPEEWKLLVEASTIQFRCNKPMYVPKRSLDQKGGLLGFLDASCSACAGTGKSACTARGCNEGIATTRVSYIEMQGIGAGQHAVNRTKTVKVQCKVCAGAGVLPCPHCKGQGLPRSR